MRASNRHRLAVLVFVATTTLHCILGIANDDVSPKPAAAAVVDNDLPVRLSEVTWSLLEAIEQYHISPPPREDLMAAVALAACQNDKRRAFAASDKLKACQSLAEFRPAFTEVWKQLPFKAQSEDSYLNLLAHSIQPTIAITPTAEYVVQDQLKNNRYVGIGVGVGMDDGRNISFSHVVSGGAADRAGLVRGDIVLEVDGHDTTNVPPNEAITKWLRGPKGTQVTLKLSAKPGVPAREVTLTRSLVRIDSVHTRNGSSISQGNFRDQSEFPIGYLRVGIKGSTLRRDAEAKLRADGVRVVIFDFRGGDSSNIFHHARLVADGLLDGGPIWLCQSRGGEAQQECADRECLFRGMPLVIIVNQNSASLQVAVAAALQDAGRAILVGESPKQGGEIFDSHSFADGAYYATFPSGKLIRSRPDRSWPLVPDHAAYDTNAAEAMERAFKAQVIANRTNTLSRFRPSLFYSFRGIDPGSTAVSALFPANLQEVEIVNRLRVQDMTDAPPRANAGNRVEEEEAARKIARQLLDNLNQQEVAAKNSQPE